QRREKLNNLLQREEYELHQELVTKQHNEECRYCTERNNRAQKYEEEIEMEKARECLKALEREKIAYGMKCSKIDEIKLREIQKMQMEERKIIEKNNAEVDELWHQVLLNDIRIKEENERRTAERRKREMIERRMAYDEQIASASRKRRETIQTEREIENRRLENMKKKMEQDYYEAIKRKKEQQLINKQNCMELHEIKLMELRNKVKQEKEIDVNTIMIAMEELRNERQKELNKIQTLKMEKDIFIDNYNRERIMKEKLQKEAEKIRDEWKEKEQREADEIIRQIKMNRQANKMNAAHEYKRYIEERSREMEIKRQERRETMKKVKRTAYNELRKKLDEANDEMRQQIEYRNTLNNQIRDDEKNLELEVIEIERKQRPFTKKAIMFKEAMRDVANRSLVSENPIHPFERKMLKNETINSSVSLPFLNK
ncbi:golgin subfamily A member 6-like protein 22, partial [Melitaea cinxia]|uniref:golgin subfamily A member 6-like protein 22 n=1 Tax=Melitaea cinxia TaxID=113334 RepID=UPI001E27291C